MPFELMVVIVVSVITGMLGVVTITKMIITAVERRRLAPPMENSMTRGELALMIDQAVREATRPLQEQLERMQTQLPAGDATRFLEPHPDDDTSADV